MSLTSLVNPLLVSEKILLFSISDLDKEEIVSKKVGKYPHCKCETGNTLSQAWSHSLHFFSIVLFPPFSNASIFPNKRGNICLCSVTVMVVLENDSVWIVTTDKGQDDKFVTGEHESFTIIVVGWEIRDLALGSLPSQCHRAAAAAGHPRHCLTGHSWTWHRDIGFQLSITFSTFHPHTVHPMLSWCTVWVRPWQ